MALSLPNFATYHEEIIKGISSAAVCNYQVGVDRLKSPFFLIHCFQEIEPNLFNMDQVIGHDNAIYIQIIKWKIKNKNKRREKEGGKRLEDVEDPIKKSMIQWLVMLLSSFVTTCTRFDAANASWPKSNWHAF